MFDPLFSLLRLTHQTLSVAESCTGGGLAHEITSCAGVSEIFLGGVVAYANEAKTTLLNVPSELILRHGAVSEEVAVAMAENCRTLFSSTFALATTGIAGPSGETLDKPLGLVWIAVASIRGAYARKFIFPQVDRLEHRRLTIEHAFLMLTHECGEKSK